MFVRGIHSQRHEASKHHLKTELVAGLSVLHLAGIMAKEDGHVHLHWELAFFPFLLGWGSGLPSTAASHFSETRNGVIKESCKSH